QPPLVLPNYLDAVVRAAAVNDDVLQVGVALQQHGADGLLDELPLVVRRRHDADPGPGRRVVRPPRRTRLLRPRPAGLARRRRRALTRRRLRAARAGAT